MSACSSSSGTTSTGRSPSSTAETGPPITPVELTPAIDPGGTVTHGTLIFADRERTYRLYVPTTRPDVFGPVEGQSDGQAPRSPFSRRRDRSRDPVRGL
jgi:hypothetical protein